MYVANTYHNYGRGSEGSIMYKWTWTGLTFRTVLLVVLASATGVADPDPIAEGKDALQARKAAIVSLTAFLQNGEAFRTRPDDAAAAATLLGELRANEAVPILLEHAAFEPHPSYHPEMISDFPCALALVRIGSAAVPGLVKLMAVDDGYAAATGGVQMLVMIDGAEMACARLRLALASEKDPERHERLARALEGAEMFRRNSHPPTVPPQ